MGTLSFDFWMYGSLYSHTAWWKSIFIENCCFCKRIKPKIICNPDLVFGLAEHLVTLPLYHLEEICHPDLIFWPALLFGTWEYFQATYKYANYVQFMLYILMYLNDIVLSQQYCAIWVRFVTKWTFGLHFICTKKSPSPWKNTSFLFNRKIRHLTDLRVTQDFLCIEPKVLPTTYNKISIVTKWVFFVTKFFGGLMGP